VPHHSPITTHLRFVVKLDDNLFCLIVSQSFPLHFIMLLLISTNVGLFPPGWSNASSFVASLPGPMLSLILKEAEKKAG
jgi:hypothetical protein